LPNVGPYIYDVSISGFTRSSIYIYDISSLRVNIHSDIQIVSLIRVADFPKTPASTLDRKCVVIAPDQGTDVCKRQKQKLSDLQCRN